MLECATAAAESLYYSRSQLEEAAFISPCYIKPSSGSTIMCKIQLHSGSVMVFSSSNHPTAHLKANVQQQVEVTGQKPSTNAAFSLQQRLSLLGTHSLKAPTTALASLKSLHNIGFCLHPATSDASLHLVALSIQLNKETNEPHIPALLGAYVGCSLDDGVWCSSQVSSSHISPLL